MPIRGAKDSLHTRKKTTTAAAEMRTRVTAQEPRHQASLNGPRAKGSPEESMAARIKGPEKVRIRATKGAKTVMKKRSQEYRPGQISREKGVIGTGQAKVAEDCRGAETGIIKESRERVLFRRKEMEEASVEKVVGLIRKDLSGNSSISNPFLLFTLFVSCRALPVSGAALFGSHFSTLPLDSQES